MLQQIRVTKIFTIEMAHVLLGYDGDCKNIHGHSYKLLVAVKGEVRNENGHVKDGMVMDFSVLKEIVKLEIIHKYDHSLVLNANSPHALIDLSAFEKVFYLPYQPTSENLVMAFATLIQSKMPKRITLCKVVLSETATSFAEWNIEDNQ